MYRIAVLGLALVVFASAWGGRPGARAADFEEGLPVGAQVVDFGLRSLELQSGRLGRMVWLSDFVPGARSRSPVPPSDRDAKKLVVLSFFAVWCKPCIEELAVLRRLQAEHGPRGLQVLSVNFRRRGEALADALAETRRIVGAEPLGFPLLFDRFTDRNQRLYMGSRATLPCAILIDGAGKLRARLQGGGATASGELERRVVELLDED